MVLDSLPFLSYTVSTMKVGDLVRMFELNYGVGVIQKILPRDLLRPEIVYRILWSDRVVSGQYADELVLISKV